MRPNQNQVSVLVASCSALLIIGSLLPWVTVEGVGSRNGTYLTLHGEFVIFAGAIALALVALRQLATIAVPRYSFLMGAALCFVVALFLSFQDYNDISNEAAAARWLVSASAGYGLYLVLAASALGAVLAIIAALGDANVRLAPEPRATVYAASVRVKADRVRSDTFRSQHAQARVSVLDAGRNVGDIHVRPGQVMMVGRADDADIRLSDPRVSRRHLEIEVGAASWIIRDLGATNPAEVIAGGPPRQIRGTETLAAGQIGVGDSVLTLYPLEPLR